MNYLCSYCGDRNITLEELYKAVGMCSICTSFRDKDPALFDFMMKVLENRIAAILEVNYNQYHGEDY